MSAELKFAMALTIARKITESQTGRLRVMAKQFLEAQWTADDENFWERASESWKYIQAHKEEWEGKL